MSSCEGGCDYRSGSGPVKRGPRANHARSLLYYIGIPRPDHAAGPWRALLERLAPYARWIPHSVFGVPAQRPARKESTETTERVQGAHPIEG